MIGQRIRKRREHLGISQKELALKIGYKDRSSVAKIENDGRNLPQDKIYAIAVALETTPAYIMGWEEKKTSEDFYDILRGFNLNNEEKESVLDYARFLLSKRK